tara:strand:- start:188 stop:1030 length:843 start_codon:yes stop_codon:yes gene_type:complete
MATINIGSLTFTHKGDYASGTAYVKNDVVYYSTNGNAYIAKQATQGNAPTNATYWSQFTQGTGGIWNAGLSLGSASQKLRVNSGGNALEFFTEPAVSSDFVKINSGSFSSASYVQIDGTSNWGASGDYKWHKLVFYKWAQSTTANLLGRQVDSGSQNTSDIYGTQIDYGYSGNSNAYSVGIESNEWRFTNDNLRGSNTSITYHKLEANIFGLYAENQYDPCKITIDAGGQNQDGDRRILGFDARGITQTGWSGNTTRTGLRFYAASGTVTGNWVTYGIKG